MSTSNGSVKASVSVGSDKGRTAVAVAPSNSDQTLGLILWVLQRKIEFHAALVEQGMLDHRSPILLFANDLEVKGIIPIGPENWTQHDPHASSAHPIRQALSDALKAEGKRLPDADRTKLEEICLGILEKFLRKGSDRLAAIYKEQDERDEAARESLFAERLAAEVARLRNGAQPNTATADTGAQSAELRKLKDELAVAKGDLQKSLHEKSRLVAEQTQATNALRLLNQQASALRVDEAKVAELTERKAALTSALTTLETKHRDAVAAISTLKAEIEGLTQQRDEIAMERSLLEEKEKVLDARQNELEELQEKLLLQQTAITEQAARLSGIVLEAAVDPEAAAVKARGEIVVVEYQDGISWVDLLTRISEWKQDIGSFLREIGKLANVRSSNSKLPKMRKGQGWFWTRFHDGRVNSRKEVPNLEKLAIFVRGDRNRAPNPG